MGCRGPRHGHAAQTRAISLRDIFPNKRRSCRQPWGITPATVGSSLPRGSLAKSVRAPSAGHVPSPSSRCSYRAGRLAIALARRARELSFTVVTSRRVTLVAFVQSAKVLSTRDTSPPIPVTHHRLARDPTRCCMRACVHYALSRDSSASPSSSLPTVVAASRITKRTRYSRATFSLVAQSSLESAYVAWRNVGER